MPGTGFGSRISRPEFLPTSQGKMSASFTGCGPIDAKFVWQRGLSMADWI